MISSLMLQKGSLWFRGIFRTLSNAMMKLFSKKVNGFPLFTLFCFPSELPSSAFQVYLQITYVRLYFFLTTIWLPHGQRWVIIEVTATYTRNFNHCVLTYSTRGSPGASFFSIYLTSIEIILTIYNFICIVLITLAIQTN